MRHPVEEPLPATWSGRDDGLGAERIHQNVECITPSQLKATQGKSFCFLGFACDEGVKRNQGRPGAAQGPESIRKSLGTLVWDAPSKTKLFDLGDIVCKDGDLEGAQKQLGTHISLLLKNKYTPIVLGGGHETAWGHFQGFSKEERENLLIINFDAHYDMRRSEKGNSGTPFLQIAEAYEKEGSPFHYLCIGIQSSSNTASLKETVKARKVETVYAEQLHQEGGLSSTLKLLEKKLSLHKRVYLSVCMDVFAQAYAPGVSAPQALGLNPWHVIPLLRKIASSGKLLSADFVELCPPLDRDFQTSKLSASLVRELLFIVGYEV